MSQKNNSNYSNRGGGGPQNGKGNMFRRNGPGKFNSRSNQSRIGERHGGGPRKDSAGKLAAHSDLATLTYCEKGSSNLLTNLKEFTDGLRIICGREFGTLFEFERTGKYPEFTVPELITQELADEIEITSIQDNIDDPNTDNEVREEPLVPIEVIRAKQIRSAAQMEALERARLESWKIKVSLIAKEEQRFTENKAKLYWIMRGNLSKSSEEKLVEHLGDEWERIQSSHDVLELWKAIVATHNAISSGNNEMDKIRMERAFQTLRQGPDETPLMFKERFTKTLEAVKQLGVDISGNADPNYSQARLALMEILEFL